MNSKKKNHIILFFLTFITLFPLIGKTQGTTIESISISYENKTLKLILKDLNKKTGVRFSYSSKQINEKQKINYSANNHTLNHIISDLSQQAHFSFEELNGYYILKKKELQKGIYTDSIQIKPETYTISGYISDASSEEALIGASFFDTISYKGAITNNYGFYSLTLIKGEYTFRCSYIGYDKATFKIKLNKNIRYDINLSPEITFMDEVKITEIDKAQEVKNFRSGQINQDPLEAKQHTMAMGETDMLKSLEKVPGISFHGDGSSYFYVRGGNRDQNLILLDEAPLYNPSHMLGLFTPIIPEAVKTTKIYKADFPVQYGGRLSSVIDIRTRDGNMEQFSGSGSIGLLATRLTLEGPIKKDASSYFISYRRSHFGMFVRRVESSVQQFFFNDFTSKFNIRLGTKDRLFLSFYRGKDVFYISNSGLDWGNNTFTTRWNHIFGEKLFLNTTFYTSKYNYNLYTNGLEEFWTTSVASTHLKPEFTYYHSPESTFRFGIKLGNYRFVPGIHSLLKGRPSLKSPSPINSSEAILFGGNEYKINDNIKINTGLRLTNWKNTEGIVVEYNNYKPTGTYTSYGTDTTGFFKYKSYFHTSFEPQLSLSFQINKLGAITASYNRTLQHINLINNSISPFNSLEAWLPSGPNIKPQKANIFNIGFIQVMKNQTFEFQADVYYKRLYNQIGYKAHAAILMNALLEGELRQGDGRAYGVEFVLRKNTGKITGQISFASLRSLLKIKELNNNEIFPAHQDKPIDFNVDVNYQIKPRWVATLNYNYGSGLRFTSPVSFYHYQGNQVPVYSKINNSKLPDYQRLDIASNVTLNKKPGKFEHHLQFSFFNFLNHQNPMFIYFNKTKDQNYNFIIPPNKLQTNNLVTTKRYMYAVIPSITYNFKF